ncbi:hypothetical protein ANABIO32_33140 [Rossellomorea marisflavi]|nr:hypothetical protein ANABIO32_33140 [Rossellomorea marisflavi]
MSLLGKPAGSHVSYSSRWSLRLALQSTARANEIELVMLQIKNPNSFALSQANEFGFYSDYNSFVPATFHF